MKFLVDAQLPARRARHLNDAGHDAVHTLDLPEQNRTTDAEIARVADTQDPNPSSPRTATYATATCSTELQRACSS